MILLLDLGNSRGKWVCKKSGQEVTSGVFPINPANNFLAHFLGFLKGLPELPKTLLVSSVLGKQFNASFAQSVTRHFALEIYFVRVERHFLGVSAGYQNLQNLGVDRWLAMLAVFNHAQYGKQSSAIISAGTAMTVDYVDRSGEHVGGLILPGLYLMYSALGDKINNLDGKLAADDRLLPRNWKPGDDTLDCINNGFSALLKAFLVEIADPQDHSVENIIITGGNAQVLHKFIPRAVFTKNLVLEGLNLYAHTKGLN